ncbi:MAG: hypothetical protein M3321_01180 [Actinomycetota bacterium]|nr:hypothetical protein [Actinomycetota bacterium]
MNDVRTAHAVLVGEYAGLLSILSRLHEHPNGSKYAEAGRFVRAHIRSRMEALVDPYTFRREAAVDDDTREWFTEAIASVERISERLPHRSPWRIFGIFMSKVVAGLALFGTVVAALDKLDLLKRIKSAGLDDAGTYAAKLASAGTGFMPIIFVVAGSVVLSWVRGFHRKRELLLGDADDVVGFTRAKGPRLRTGANIYELETALFAALGFSKPEEKQFDARLATFVAALVWAGGCAYFFVVETSWVSFASWIGSGLFAVTLAVLGHRTAARRAFK